MALLADDAAHRVEQLILLSERLSALVAQEAERMEARLPLLEGAEAEEKNLDKWMPTELMAMAKRNVKS